MLQFTEKHTNPTPEPMPFSVLVSIAVFVGGWISIAIASVL